jgi:hypothetical protein
MSLTYDLHGVSFPATVFTTGGEMEFDRGDVLPYLKALLLLQLEMVRDQESSVKPEVLLHRAGIPMTEIAEMLDKKYAAIAKTISRAKGGAAKEQP